MPHPSSSSKPVLAVDFDDTLVTFAQQIVMLYNQQHSATITLDSMYVSGALGKPEHGWKSTPADALAWIDSYLRSKEALEREPLPGAGTTLAELSRDYTLIVVTGRDEGLRRTTQTWLDKHLPGVFSGLYCAGQTKKSTICQEQGVSIIIEDNPAYVHQCRQVGVRGILFGDYPWNQNDLLVRTGLASLHEIERVASWNEVVGKINHG